MPADAKQIEQQNAGRQWKQAPPDPEGLQRLLVELDRPLIDAAVRARLLRLQQFYGEGHVRLLIITITESEGNRDALVEPIVSAVSDIMRRRPDWPERDSEWLEAFDQVPLVPMLDTFRSLDAFTDSELARHYMIAVGRRLGRTFSAKEAPETPPAANRVAGRSPGIGNRTGDRRSAAGGWQIECPVQNPDSEPEASPLPRLPSDGA